MESETGYPTAPHDMNLVQDLRRGPNGWSGKGWIADREIWRVWNNIIKIKSSDANSTRVPGMEQRKRTVDDEGNFSQWVQLGEEEYLYQLWMRKIGPYLADWVLGKGRHGTSHAMQPFSLYPGLALTKNPLYSFARMEAPEVSRRLHALAAQNGRRNGPRQPAHRRVPPRRPAPRSAARGRTHVRGTSRAERLPLADGVCRARDMAHALRRRRRRMPVPVQVQVLHARPEPARH